MTDKKLLEAINAAIKEFEGDCHELESAIGAALLGRRFGWKPLFLLHRPNTIKKYEKHLGIDFREIMPPVGDCAKKSVAWCAIQKVSNFWKAVKGEIPGVRSTEIT